MRIALALILLCAQLASGQVVIRSRHRLPKAGSSFAIVQHKKFRDWSNFFSTWNVSFDNPTVAGNAIIVVPLGNGISSISVTDDHSGGSNTYHQDLTFPFGGVFLVRYFSVPNAGSAQTVTFTFNSSAHIQVELLEVSGLATSSADDKTSTNDNSYHNNPSGVAFTSGSTATTAQANEFLLGFAINVYPGNVTWTDDSPWSLLDLNGADGVRMAYRTASSTAAYAYTGTYGNTGDTEVFAAIVTYKMAA
jgi:hypothetical protein